MDTQPVVIERYFNIPPSKLWQALTNNEHLKHWYFKLPEFNAVEGFKFSFMGGEPDDPKFLHLCEVTKVVENRILSYTWRYDGLPGNSLVSWELFPENAGTRLRLTHSGLETIAPAGPEFARENFLGGWDYFVNEALASYFETQN